MISITQKEFRRIARFNSNVSSLYLRSHSNIENCNDKKNTVFIIEY